MKVIGLEMLRLNFGLIPKQWIQRIDCGFEIEIQITAERYDDSNRFTASAWTSDVPTKRFVGHSCWLESPESAAEHAVQNLKLSIQEESERNVGAWYSNSLIEFNKKLNEEYEYRSKRKMIATEFFQKLKLNG